MKLGKFLAFFAMLNIIAIPAYASEKLPAGSVLKEEFMVFTLDEARRMAEYISQLEQQVQKQEELLSAKDELIENKDEQIASFKDYQDLQRQQIAKYLEIQEIDQGRIKTLERQAKTKKFETAGAFVGGIAVAVILIIVADQLDDKVLEAGAPANNSSTARTSGLTVRF